MGEKIPLVLHSQGLLTDPGNEASSSWIALAVQRVQKQAFVRIINFAQGWVNVDSLAQSCTSARPKMR